MRPPSLADLDAVIFDVGGTLLELDFERIAGLAREGGAVLAPDALRRGEVLARRSIDARARRRGSLEGNDEERRFHYFTVLLEAAGVDPRVAAPISDAIDAAHADENLWRVEIEGASATLAGLRARGVATAVVSNADGRVAAMLERRGLATHLGPILDSHLEGVEKPDPEIFARALARLGVEARRAAYVGDIYSIDALGARAAGLTPVLLDPLGGYPDVDCATLPRLSALLSDV